MREKRPGKLSLTVFGISGVGKTHLLQSVAWQALGDGFNVAYFKAPSLIELVNEAFKSKKTSFLRDEVASADLLLIDDVQMFNNKKLDAARGFLFALVDMFLGMGKPIVVTSDVRPERESWKHIEERIRQRLTLCGSVSIHSPGADFVKRFVESRLALFGVGITEDALEVLAQVGFTTVRELEMVVWLLKRFELETVGRKEALAVLPELRGVRTRCMDGRNRLSCLWERVLERFFEPIDVDQVLRGGRLGGESGRLLTLLRWAFAKVAVERGASKANVARFFGVTPAALYKWEKELQRREGDTFVEALVEAVRSVFEGDER